MCVNQKSQRPIITPEMIEAAAQAMIEDMFAPHELPVSYGLWAAYYGTARLALVAALEIQPHQRPIRSTPDSEGKP